MTRSGPARQRHLVDVWNPSYASDAMTAHLTVLLEAAQRASSLECDFWYRLLDIRRLVGDDTPVVIEKLKALLTCRSHEECTAALQAAREQWGAGSPSGEHVGRLGEGWVADEALAIGVYCALAAGEDFAAGVRLAVNHGGDSDSTGAIAGNLLGAAHGGDAIPRRWLDKLELRQEIEALADDMLTWFREDEAWWQRYPGW